MTNNSNTFLTNNSNTYYHWVMTLNVDLTTSPYLNKYTVPIYMQYLNQVGWLGLPTHCQRYLRIV